MTFVLINKRHPHTHTIKRPHYNIGDSGKIIKFPGNFFANKQDKRVDHQREHQTQYQHNQHKFQRFIRYL